MSNGFGWAIIARMGPSSILQDHPPRLIPLQPKQFHELGQAGIIPHSSFFFFLGKSHSLFPPPCARVPSHEGDGHDDEKLGGRTGNAVKPARPHRVYLPGTLPRTIMHHASPNEPSLPSTTGTPASWSADGFRRQLRALRHLCHGGVQLRGREQAEARLEFAREQLDWQLELAASQTEG